jgi:hypothetical protein
MIMNILLTIVLISFLLFVVSFLGMIVLAEFNCFSRCDCGTEDWGFPHQPCDKCLRRKEKEAKNAKSQNDSKENISRP